MVVELDIFSGRPNPRWELDSEASRQLRTLVSAVPATTDEPPVPAGLGYRGFRWWDGTETCWAYRGFLVCGGRTSFDPELSVERWLLAHLPDELHGEGRAVEAEIERL